MCAYARETVFRVRFQVPGLGEGEMTGSMVLHRTLSKVSRDGKIASNPTAMQRVDGCRC